MEQLKVVANYGQQATQMTLDLINNNINNNNNPTLHAQQRRMIDLFMVLYGSFRWDDVAAKTRVRDRAVRVNQMAAIFANGLIQNTANWNFFCDESEWVLDPNVPSDIKEEFWMVKDLPAGPRKHKVSASLCTIPQGYKAGFGGRQAEAVTLTAKHTQGNPNWITFCAGVWSQLKFLTRVWYQPANKAAVVKNGDFLYDMIHNTPERLLAHEFTHGEGQFGDYYGRDTKYGWVAIVQLAKDDNAQTDATKSQAVSNADTFTYWINGVYLEMCNFRSGRCEDPDQAANTPQN
ncbi:transcriptional regulator family: Fungal Specific TF [Penicillium chrysogenum]|nr:transcriptional regulator family: Fungal Specific TF [Penicillium chrysogenum]